MTPPDTRMVSHEARRARPADDKVWPFFSHRTLREVAETEELMRRWDYGESLGHADRQRLADLLAMSIEANGDDA